MTSALSPNEKTQPFTQPFTKIDLNQKRSVVGVAHVTSPCLICGNEKGGLYELPEYTRGVFYLCDKCSWQTLNARIATAGQFGWCYPHSWHALEVNIKRKSGKVHKAKISYLFEHKDMGYFKCLWNENTEDGSCDCKGVDGWYSEHSIQVTKGLSYQELKELNPMLPPLECFPVLYGIPIADQTMERVKQLLSKTKPK